MERALLIRSASTVKDMILIIN